MTSCSLRWSVAAIAAALSLFAAARLWFVEGLLRRATIDGPSMAPALCGESYAVACADCGFAFRCDAQHVPSDHRAACPNCGYADNSLQAARRLPPDRVIIDRWPLLFRAPQRGDVVALQSPVGELTVKRIAAQPGERLAIDSGDLHAGDVLLRKTRQQQNALRLLVHDNHYQPRKSGNLPQRWRPATADSQWKTAGGHIEIAPSPTGPAIDWIEYEHWPCTVDTSQRGVASPVSDNDAYNQGETTRTLNAVPDVLLTCRLHAQGSGHLVLAANDGDQRFEVEIEPRSRVTLRSGSQTLVDRPLTLSFSQSIDIEFALLDQQVLLAAGGRTLVLQAYDRPPGPRPETLHPLAIGARGLGLSLSQLRVWRDVYYLDPNGLVYRPFWAPLR